MGSLPLPPLSSSFPPLSLFSSSFFLLSSSSLLHTENIQKNNEIPIENYWTRSGYAIEGGARKIQKATVRHREAQTSTERDARDEQTHYEMIRHALRDRNR